MTDQVNHPNQCKRPSCTRARYANHGYCHVHAKALGLTNPRHPIAELHSIIDELEERGWTRAEIAQQIGVQKRYLHRALRQNTVGQNTITRVTALTHQDPPGVRTRPVWPTQRRLRSLRAAGHQARHIAHTTGVDPATISEITHGHITTGRIHTATADAISEYWDAHHRSPVTTPDPVARKQRWVPPMWWDNIDDPGEQPGVTHCLRCHRNGEVLVDGLCGRCRNHDAVRRYKQRKQAA